MKDEQLYSIALTRIPGLGLIGIHKLVDALGSATAVFRNRKDLCELVPGISPKQIKALDCPEACRRRASFYRNEPHPLSDTDR